MSVELASAWVSLVPSTRGLRGQVEREITGPLEQASAAAGVAGGRSFGGNLLSNAVSGLHGLGDRILGVATSGLKVAGLAAGATFAASLWGGMQRTLDTEDARKLFGQLGLGMADTDDLMDDLRKSFETGPFAYPDVFDISSQLLASGIGLDRLVDTTAAVGNMAAFAGEDLSRVGEVTQVIGANGRVMASELNRLGQMGIPIRQILAEALGVSGEQLTGMVSDGQLTSEMFFDLIGDAEQFSGAMEQFGSTTRGAWQIMRAGIAGVGEQLLSPWFGEDGDMVQFLSRINAVIFDKVQPAVAAFGEQLRDRLLPAFARAEEFFTGTLVPAISTAVDWFREHREMIGQVAKAVGPAVAVVGALATSFALVAKVLGFLGISGPVLAIMAIAAGLTYAWQNSETFRNIVTGAFNAVRRVIGPVVDAVSGLVERFRGGDGLGGAMDRVRSVIDRVVGAFREGGAIFEWFSGLWSDLQPRFESIGDAFRTIGEVLGPIVSWIGERLPGAFQFLWSIAGPIIGFIANLIGETLRLAIDGIVQVFQGAVNLIAGILETFAGLFTGDWSRMWEGIKQIGIAIWDTIVGLVKTWLAVSVMKVIGGALKAIGSLFTRSWSAIRGVFSRAGQSIVSTVRGWLDTVRLRLMYAMDAARALVRRAWEAIGATFIRAGGQIVNAVLRAFNSVRTTVRTAMSNLRNAVRDGINRVLDFFRDLPRRIIEAIGNIGGRMREAGGKIMTDFADGIRGRVGDVTGAVTGALGSVRNLLPESPAKEGPFSGRGWTRYSGQALMEGFAQGIGEQARAPVQAVDAAMARAQAAMRPGLAAAQATTAAGTSLPAPSSDGRSGVRDLHVHGRVDPVAQFRARNLLENELGAMA
jgi:tape measure domain-containing protein